VIDSHPLLHGRLRAVIEQVVSEYKGMSWEVSEFRDMNAFSSHPSAILSDGLYSVFVKLSSTANGLEQFEAELAGLRLLSERAGVRIPAWIGNVAVEGGAVLILEGLRAVDRTSQGWRQIGAALAQIHRIQGEQFGLETHNYFGPLYQDNRFMDSWPAFYAERRLWPRLMGAVNAGHLPAETIRDAERLILRLPELCGPDVPPTLVHGDAQQNNFISTEVGAVVIDPAVHYGHPEMDLAYVDYFQPVPADLFSGYQEYLSIDPGFNERRELWRIYGYLAAVEVEGASYLPRLASGIRSYL
jgi:fructosamine-3-kinase